MSIASLVIGIVGVFATCCCGMFGIPLPIIGLVLGFIGRNNEPEQQGMATAGIVINALVILGMIALTVLLVVFQVALPAFMQPRVRPGSSF